MAYNYNVTNPTYSYARKPNATGGFNFFYNGKPVTQEFYSNVSGIPRDAALSGSYTPAPKPIGNLYGNQNVRPTPISYTPYTPTAHISYAGATQQATKAVTPFYQKQLALSLQGLNVNKQQYQTSYKNTLSDITKNLSQSLEDYGVNRTRTTEDVTKNLASLGAERKETMGAESRQAVKDREAALQELSQGTGIYGGMGKQQITAADVERRATAKAVTRKYTETTGQQETYLSRTLGDIAKGETRAKEGAVTGKARAKIDLDQWLKGWGIEVQLTKRASELKKQQDIWSRASSIYESKYY